MVPSIDTAYQVRKEVAERSENILRDWTLLNWFLRHHELTIRHRWWKRNVAQRKKLLLVSWPNMPQSRRPDIAADIQQSHWTSCYKEAFLWPNICLEVLVAKKLFLYYLNSRGRYRPHNFIAADRASAEYGVLTKNIEIFSLDNYEIAFVNEASSEYGKLLETKCSMNSHLRMKIGDGLLGLEIQERLYQFLVTCAASLLPDISREQYLSEIVPAVPEPPLIDLDTDSSQSGVAANYTPYRLPAKFDITRLLALINAKRAATKDHIWALREDPWCLFY
ncbi:hypothetical protein N7524_011806 [Penicillium chrysogenum]|nr:hypothetical protein N7524_011806 [Penicillium chrysogenum]